jgi:hypothetical protein
MEEDRRYPSALVVISYFTLYVISHPHLMALAAWFHGNVERGMHPEVVRRCYARSHNDSRN